MKKVIFIATVLCISVMTHAQDLENNALLFSRTQALGSARVQGMGGPKAALGGDYSSSLINPAGLGMYNRNEVTITPSLKFINSTSRYYDTSAPKDSRSAVSIPGFSLVLNVPSDNEKGYLGGSFAITLSRTNDFHQDYSYQGYNDQNSLIDYFIGNAGDIDPDDFEWDENEPDPGPEYFSLPALAYNNFLIEPFVDDNGDVIGYSTVLDFSSVRQREISERKGSQSQWSISYGANFNDKFFAGVAIGIASIRYKMSQVFIEDDFGYNNDADVALSDYTLTENYDIRGAGVNLTLGAIYRPFDFLQFGASLVTPTFYALTDKYFAGLESNWNNYRYYPDQNLRLNDEGVEFPEDQIWEYNITTPLKVHGGFAVIQKFGLFSVDVEYVNYPKAKYSSETAGEFTDINDNVQGDYKSVLNYSLGLELRHDFMRFRVGGNYLADPFQTKDDLDRSIKTYTTGLGFRSDKFFVDLALNYSTTQGQRIPYNTSVGNANPLATSKFKATHYLMTFGFTF